MDDGIPLDSGAMAVGDPGAGAALDVLGKQTVTPDIVKVTGREDYDRVPHGSAYLDPEGKKRFKPIRDRSDYQSLPEGAEYADPTGQIRTKPSYQGIDFTPQMLYDMSHSDKGRKKALEKFYPGKVKEDGEGGFVIDDEGTLRKPGRGASKVGGFLAADAPTMALSTLGSLAGGAAGTAVLPGVGTVAGGASGAALGGYLGSRLNDAVAQLAGVYDEEGADDAALWSAGLSATGELGGRALSAAAPAIKEGGRQIAQGASKAVNKFLGTNEEKLATALPIAEAGEKPGAAMFGRMSKPGTAVSPSSVFESSPHITNVAEILQQKFDKSDTFMENAERFMDKRAHNILANPDIGTLVESVTKPKAAVPTEAAGALLKTSMQSRAVEKSAEHDAMLKQLLEVRKGTLESTYATDIETHRANADAIQSAAVKAKESADALVQQGIKQIEKDADSATKLAGFGYNDGGMYRQVAQDFVKLRQGIQTRATKMYGDAETASGGLVPPGSNGLSRPAEQLLSELPDGFESLHPSIVKKLRDMAGIKDPKTGEWVKEPADASWVQLHNLRTQIRQDIKWNDLTSDVRNGTLKFLDGKINEVLHPLEEHAAPQIKEASKLLKLADNFYRENMGPLNHTQLRTLVKAMDAGGVAADPKQLLKVAIRDGSTEVANIIKKTVGPQTWNAMRAADVKEMMQQSRTLAEDGSIDAVKFAKQVLDRKQNNVLEVLHGAEGAARLEQQARYVQQLKGDLAISPKPGDTVNDIILRARAAAADAEKQAAEDPFKLLKKETQVMLRDHAALQKKLAAERSAHPLNFLLDPNVGANKAIERITKDPDLIVAASRAFQGGENSPEFQLIRQVWAERFLRGGMDVGERLGTTSEEIQKLMFPGVTLKDMHTLAKEMELLMSGATMRGGGGDVGGSMMAQSAVEHPLGRISGLGRIAGPAKMVPGLDFGLRAGLTAYYNMVRGLVTSPSTLRWLMKGFNSRDPIEKEAARAELRAALQKGGAMGAGAGAAANQWGNQPAAPGGVFE